MATKDDHIPGNDGEFNTWFKHLMQTVNVKTTGQTPEWTHIPASEVTLLTGAYGDWYTAYAPTLTPHTPEETLVKDKARKDAEAIIRPFVGQWLMWKQVTDAEREGMGLHNKKPRRDHIPAPTTVPVLVPKAGNPRQLLVPYQDRDSSHKGKPADVHGIEVRWALRDTPPEDIEKDLLNSSFDTKSPLVLTFGEEDRGKRIYLAGRWEIVRDGIMGDFGEFVSAIIP
jgi:hypothetical protein